MITITKPNNQSPAKHRTLSHKVQIHLYNNFRLYVCTCRGEPVRYPPTTIDMRQMQPSVIEFVNTAQLVRIAQTCFQVGRCVALTFEQQEKIVRSDIFTELCDKFNTSDLRVLTPSDIHKVLTRIQNSHDFIPNGLWTVKYQCFADMNLSCHIVTDEFQSAVCTSSKADDDKVIDVSFGSTFRCARGIGYVCDLYVDLGLDDDIKTKLQIGHVLRHLILINQRFKGELIDFRLFTDPGLGDKAYSFVFSEVLGLLTDERTNMNYVIIEDTEIVSGSARESAQ